MDMVPIEIDLDVANKQEINEESLQSFAGKVKSLMWVLFGGVPKALPVSVTGTPGQLSAFQRSLAAEKRYMDSYKTHGLTDPQTYKNKYVLDNAVQKFETATGLKWPFK